MKKMMFVFVMLVLVTGITVAQNEAILVYNGVEFAYVPASFGAVLPGIEAGTPYQADAPYFANIAPHTNFVFSRPNPAQPDVIWSGMLRIYRIADLEAYDETSYREIVEQLRQLDKATLADYATVNPDYQSPHLPFMPTVNATQVMRTHPSILNTENMEGIQYYTYYSTGLEPIIEGQIMYAYQAITTDGLYYISFSMPVETGLLDMTIPEDFDWEQLSAMYNDYLQDIFTTINTAEPESFSPTADDFRQFIESLKIKA